MSLVEVIVAIGILLVMSAMVFRALHSSIEFHNLLSNRDETSRTARAAMSKISRDLQLAFLTPNRQAIASYETVFVGFDEEPSKLFFSSLNHQRLYLNSRECDQTEITIWGEQAPSERGSGYVLYHREGPRVDQEPDEGGVIWPLAYNVRSFSLRYLDQLTGDWKTEWDTRSADTPYRLPRAVEIGLVLIAPDPEDTTGERTVDVPFMSRVVLEYAERIPNPNDAFGQSMAGSAGAAGASSLGGGVNGMMNGMNGTGIATGTGTGWPTYPPGFQLPGGQGGLGGMGSGGLSGGGAVGGMLGALGGQQQQSRPSRGGGPSRGPARGSGAVRPGGGR
jgi:general secretion pathway protein J